MGMDHVQGTPNLTVLILGSCDQCRAARVSTPLSLAGAGPLSGLVLAPCSAA